MTTTTQTPALDPALAAAVPGGVLVVDFGAQYSQLIARRIRECRVFSAVVPHDTPPQEIQALKPAGLVLSGGPASVYAPGAPALDPRLLDLGIPVLGICYGLQAMTLALGGEVARTGAGEYGKTPIEVRSRDGMFAQLPAEQCWMSHRDAVARAARGLRRHRVHRRRARWPRWRAASAGLYGVQFHPEVVHTPFGTDLLKWFLFEACDCDATWTAAHVIEEQVERVRAQVGDARAICGLSGGVDSAVAALIVHKAIGDRLTCVFVDHGLMRRDEGQQVEEAFGRHFGVPLVHVRAQDHFIGALGGVTEPEEKRKTIGREFIRIFEREAGEAQRRRASWCRGRSTPTSSSRAPATRRRSRATTTSAACRTTWRWSWSSRCASCSRTRCGWSARSSGFPRTWCGASRSPGPGLAIRIIGEVTQERLDILRHADFVLQEEIRRAGMYRDLWQSFAVLPAIKSVGVQGDERTYAYPIVIRAVTSDDAMTADWARLPYDLLERISSRIINEVDGVNRVALDLTSKPPGTIEWE